jgi:hypothetical protein
MKKIVSLIFAGSLIFGSVNAQILSEQNVTINVDLQPVLQLNLEGPTQHDFNFTEVRDYYGGITKYGANVLKVSSTVAFDLWANGVSQNAAMIFDQSYRYNNGGGGALGLNTLPLSAMELHQFPANPAAGNLCDQNVATPVNHDYSAPFTPVLGTGIPAPGTGNNSINLPTNATPYQMPTQAAIAATNAAKYIAGGDGLDASCTVQPGTYLNTAPAAGNQIGNAGYYFVMDYRLVPGLPANFPMHLVASVVNSTNANLVQAQTDAGIQAAAGSYINPGMYNMAIKYILAENQ